MGAPRIASACGEGVSDSNCGSNWLGGPSDANCGIGTDPDNNCGTWNAQSNDGNCGNPSSGGVSTDGPNGTDNDEACTTSTVDSNCSINQVPNNGAGADVDESCGNVYMSPDESCGDCDDNHNTDEHCGQTTTGNTVDPDDLCGHQHWTETFGESQDGVCSTTESDVGCGAHTTEYGGTWSDPDQHCSGTTGTNADRNCSTLSKDDTCAALSNPSTTSPDECCGGVNDLDEACSRYDKDESCGNKNTRDEACGTTPVSVLSYTDIDNHCGKSGDPDDSASTTTCPLGGG